VHLHLAVWVFKRVTLLVLQFRHMWHIKKNLEKQNQKRNTNQILKGDGCAHFIILKYGYLTKKIVVH